MQVKTIFKKFKCSKSDQKVIKCSNVQKLKCSKGDQKVIKKYTFFKTHKIELNLHFFQNVYFFKMF